MADIRASAASENLHISEEPPASADIRKPFADKRPNRRSYPKKTDVFLFHRALRARAIPGHELLLPDIGPPSRPFANPLQRKGRVCTDAARFMPIKNTPRSCAARPSSFKSER